MTALRIATSLLALAAGHLAMACEYPPLVAIPQGREATLDEMLQAQTEVRNYVVTMEAYLACVGEELADAGNNAPDLYKAILFNRHNVAVAELETVATHFNEQVQLYRCSTQPVTSIAGEGSGGLGECAGRPAE